jgi:hypothetical protein
VNARIAAKPSKPPTRHNARAPFFIFEMFEILRRQMNLGFSCSKLWRYI